MKKLALKVLVFWQITLLVLTPALSTLAYAQQDCNPDYEACDQTDVSASGESGVPVAPDNSSHDDYRLDPIETPTPYDTSNNANDNTTHFDDYATGAPPAETDYSGVTQQDAASADEEAQRIAAQRQQEEADAAAAAQAQADADAQAQALAQQQADAERQAQEAQAQADAIAQQRQQEEQDQAAQQAQAQAQAQADQQAQAQADAIAQQRAQEEQDQAAQQAQAQADQQAQQEADRIAQLRQKEEADAAAAAQAQAQADAIAQQRQQQEQAALDAANEAEASRQAADIAAQRQQEEADAAAAAQADQQAQAQAQAQADQQAQAQAQADAIAQQRQQEEQDQAAQQAQAQADQQAQAQADAIAQQRAQEEADANATAQTAQDAQAQAIAQARQDEEGQQPAQVCTESFNDCVRTECDSNLHQLVCIQQTEDKLCQITTSPGRATGQACGGGDPTAADSLINSCVRKVCDTQFGDYGKMVCIEQWRDPNGISYEKSGALTNEDCAYNKVEALRTASSNSQSCTLTRLTECDSKVCDMNIHQNVCIERWQGADCQVFTKQGAPSGEYCNLATAGGTAIAQARQSEETNATVSSANQSGLDAQGQAIAQARNAEDTTQVTTPGGTSTGSSDQPASVQPQKGQQGAHCETAVGVAGTYNANGDCEASVRPPNLTAAVNPVYLTNGTVQLQNIKDKALELRSQLPLPDLTDEQKQARDYKCGYANDNPELYNTCIKAYDLDKQVLDEDAANIAALQQKAANGELTADQIDTLNKYVQARGDLNVQYTQNRVDLATSTPVVAVTAIAGAAAAAPVAAAYSAGGLLAAGGTAVSGLLSSAPTLVAGGLGSLVAGDIAQRAASNLGLDQDWFKFGGQAAGGVAAGGAAGLARGGASTELSELDAATQVSSTAEKVAVEKQAAVDTAEAAVTAAGNDPAKVAEAQAALAKAQSDAAAAASDAKTAQAAVDAATQKAAANPGAVADAATPVDSTVPDQPGLVTRVVNGIKGIFGGGKAAESEVAPAAEPVFVGGAQQGEENDLFLEGGAASKSKAEVKDGQINPAAPNQDSQICSAGDGICAAADGISSHVDSHQASRIATEQVQASLQSLPDNPTTEQVEGAMVDGYLNAATTMENQLGKAKNAGGTTLTVAKIFQEEGQNKATILHVGDSRAYSFSDTSSGGGSLNVLTRDANSVINSYVDNGTITEADAKAIQSYLSDPTASKVLDSRPDLQEIAKLSQGPAGTLGKSYLGGSNFGDPVVQTVDLPTNTKYVVTVSDGVTKNLDDSTINTILNNSKSPQEAADKLVAEASKAARASGNVDDITASVIQIVKGDYSSPAGPSFVEDWLQNTGIYKFFNNPAVNPQTFPVPAVKQGFNLHLITPAYAADTPQAAPAIKLQALELGIKADLLGKKLKEKGSLTTQDLTDIAKIDPFKQVVKRDVNGYKLTTGRDGKVQTTVEKGNYTLDIAPIPGVDITVPQVVTVNNDKVTLPIAVKKGSGKIAKIATDEKRGLASLFTLTPAFAATESANVSSSTKAQIETFAFDDQNGNGKYDPGEPKLSWVGFNIGLKHQIQQQSIVLETGWNLISLPFHPEQGMTASKLLADIKSQGLYATAVSQLNDGVWQTFVARGDRTYSGEDFALEMNKGYFVNVVKGGTYIFKGTPVQEVGELTLNAGWNTLGVLSTQNNSNAKQVLENLNKQLSTTTTAKYYNGLWSSYLKYQQNYYGRNFTLGSGQGYVVKLEKGGIYKL